jgi:L-lysine 2,3-aminomutase
MEINRQLEAATIQKARADEEIERAKAQVKSDLVARYAAKLTTEKLRANILEQILTDANEHLRRIDRSGLLHDPLLLDQIALVLKGQSK